MRVTTSRVASFKCTSSAIFQDQPSHLVYRGAQGSHVLPLILSRDLSRRPHKSQAFTLVELLVVIAIIGILVALLLPAVQAAREAARRSQCTNNLKQLMIGVHLHHDSKNELPGAHNYYNPSDAATHTNHGYVTYILPYIEQPALYDMMDLTKRWNQGDNGRLVTLSENGNIPTLLCPSSEHMGNAELDYAAINGPNATTYNTYAGTGWKLYNSWETDPARKRAGELAAYQLATFPPIGPKAMRRGVRFKDITDGTTNSLSMGECAGRTDAGRYWGNGDNSFAHHTFINNPAEQNNELYSDHPAGVNITLADGSVRFMNEDTPIKIIDFLATRTGGELLPEQF
jgi:prepilin-type N-terminal cleavage/methylation domain-containing protein